MVTGLWTEYLATSPNLWHRKAREIAHEIPNPTFVKESLRTILYQGGAHYCLLEFPANIAHILKDQENASAIHFSQESMKPYYSGRIVAKQSPWQTILDNHIRILHQVTLHYTILSLYIHKGHDFDIMWKAILVIMDVMAQNHRSIYYGKDGKNVDHS